MTAKQTPPHKLRPWPCRVEDRRGVHDTPGANAPSIAAEEMPRIISDLPSNEQASVLRPGAPSSMKRLAIPSRRGSPRGGFRRPGISPVGLQQFWGTLRHESVTTCDMPRRQYAERSHPTLSSFLRRPLGTRESPKNVAGHASSRSQSNPSSQPAQQ